MHSKNDLDFMGLALSEAKKGEELGEVPVGAILVRSDEVIASSPNTKESLTNPCGHAEINVIKMASEKLGRWRLDDCSLYVTLEPCLMCAGAILQARIPQLYFGASDPKAGAVVSLYKTLNDSRLNHSVEIQGGLFENECSQILKDFFKAKRNH